MKKLLFVLLSLAFTFATYTAQVDLKTLYHDLSNNFNAYMKTSKEIQQEKNSVKLREMREQRINLWHDFNNLIHQLVAAGQTKDDIVRNMEESGLKKEDQNMFIHLMSY